MNKLKKLTGIVLLLLSTIGCNKMSGPRSNMLSDQHRILVKDFNNKTIVLNDINLEKEGLSIIKDMVYDKIGIKQEEQRYTFRGRMIIDSNKPLIDYGLQGESTLSLTSTLKGGMICSLCRIYTPFSPSLTNFGGLCTSCVLKSICDNRSISLIPPYKASQLKLKLKEQKSSFKKKTSTNYCVEYHCPGQVFKDKLCYKHHIKYLKVLREEEEEEQRKEKAAKKRKSSNNINVGGRFGYGPNGWTGGFSVSGSWG